MQNTPNFQGTLSAEECEVGPLLRVGPGGTGRKPQSSMWSWMGLELPGTKLVLHKHGVCGAGSRVLGGKEAGS